MNKSYVLYLLIFVAGVAAANRVRALPLGNKIPSL